MRRLATLIAFLVLAVHQIAAADPPPKGTNCNLTEPPQAAGEEMNHGVTLRIFPRAKDIDAKYTGCQSLGAPNKSDWVLVSMVEIINGDPVRIWAPPGSGVDELTACQFKAGRVVRGNPSKCPAPDFLILRSVAPGCVERIREAVAKGGIGVAHPAGCGYE